MRFVILLLAGAGCSTNQLSDAGTDTTGTGPEPPDTGAVTPDEVRVTVHPEIATVLVVEWFETDPADETWLSWTVDGAAARSPSEPRPAGSASQVVLGVPSDTRVDDLAVHSVRGGVERVREASSATTGPLPQNLRDAVLTHALPEARPEPWLLTSVDVGPYAFFGPCYTVVFDAAGRVVWYRASEGTRLTWHPRVSRSGDTLLVDEVLTYTWEDPGIPNVHRMTLDLAVDDRMELPGMISFDELDDGGFVYAEAVNDLEFHLVRRRPDGSDERVWSCAPWVFSYSVERWACATNHVAWEPTRGTVTWSMFETDTVVEVSLETGTIVAEYGRYPGGFAFDPDTTMFERQHEPSWTPEGTLLVSSHAGDTQVAREFEVDAENRVLRQIWSAESTDLATYGGGIRSLPGGHRLWQLGTGGAIAELTAEGEVVWRVEVPHALVGRVTPLADLYPFTR